MNRESPQHNSWHLARRSLKGRMGAVQPAHLPKMLELPTCGLPTGLLYLDSLSSACRAAS